MMRVLFELVIDDGPTRWASSPEISGAANLGCCDAMRYRIKTEMIVKDGVGCIFCGSDCERAGVGLAGRRFCPRYRRGGSR
ncbi:Uncharacterised protein [Mycobacteroides abscessus subsp. massiliense]|nr:Uncharacterised protein [Mycobacteroides abscessus subsp. massiliense]